MTNQRKNNASPKKADQHVSSNQSVDNSKIIKVKSGEAQSSSSFLFILLVGFVLMIAFTVWSSIQTYSNNYYSDME
jgi:hypothetical protein